MNETLLTPWQAADHLHPESWDRSNRLLAAKAIGEFAHEKLWEPELLRRDGPWGHYRIVFGFKGDQAAEYRFRAKVMCLDHWHVDKDSIERWEGDKETPFDVLRLIVEAGDRLGIPPDSLPEYLTELACTLSSAAYKSNRHEQMGLDSDGLARGDFQLIETGMTEGHPIFLANNGRLGFDALDYRKYAPEAAHPTVLLWLAADKSRVEFACVGDLSRDGLLAREIGSKLLSKFRLTIAEKGLDPELYFLIPVHPWQWENRLAQLFAPDLANGWLVYLGPGEDRYFAQQSIRTFFNISNPCRYYVKTSLSILNMGFTRGISPSISTRAAAVNEWADALVRGDATLQACRFSVLREVAFIGYRHRLFEAISDKRSDDRKEMLAAIWRENPTLRLKSGQRLMTMAALMHIDADGKALLPALMRLSGLGCDAWMRAYLLHYLKPLLHCFYAHHLLFTPHCENTLLVLEGHVVTAVILKDLAEDIGVCNPENALPLEVNHLALRVPEEVMTLGIFTDVFDCVFRFLTPILQEQAGYPEQRFWALVAECIHEYQREHPALAAKFRRYDLFAPTFIRNCLNRLQLRNNRQMVDLNAPDPVDSLQMVGVLQNPIAAYREGTPDFPAPSFLSSPDAKEAHAST